MLFREPDSRRFVSRAMIYSRLATLTSRVLNEEEERIYIEIDRMESKKSPLSMRRRVQQIMNI